LRNQTFECLTQVAVLVPVRGEAGEVIVPVWRYADSGVIEVWAGRWIDRPGKPVAGENHSEGSPLPFWTAVS